MKIWIDDSQCSERFHTIESLDDGWLVRHADGGECDAIEFRIQHSGLWEKVEEESTS